MNNWLTTCGRNEKDAMNKAVECLAGYLYELRRDGESGEQYKFFTDSSGGIDC